MKDLLTVREHYQDYPYPPRDPEDEVKRLVQISGCFLGELNHYLYRGREDFKLGFRVLVAGGGTGDSLIYLAEQLKYTDAEIIYLDFSFASLEIAQKRAEVRGLQNITWICDSILNIPELKLGKFDFIECSGVLHHLAIPDDGFKILKNSLTDRGGMSVMIYAKYGRTGVYQAQKLMQLINSGVSNRTEEITNCKTMLSNLPVTNWFMKAESCIADHKTLGDSGIYDLLLHKQDRAYSISEMYEFIKKANLHFVEFSDPKTKLLLKPENYITNHRLLQKIKSMDIIKQQEICELIIGNVMMRCFLVSVCDSSIACIQDLDNVPYFYYNTDYISQRIYDHLAKNTLLIGTNIGFKLNNASLGFETTITLSISEYTRYIFKNIIASSNKSLQEIFDAIRQELNRDLSDELLINEAKTALAPFFEAGILFLRHKSINPYTDYAAAKL